jgi:nicotinate dehydrogenase subunit B
MTNLSNNEFPNGFSRRDLLKAGGALVVSFAFATDRAAAQAATSLPPTGKPVANSEVDSFIAVHADGTVTVYTGKVDLGTGLRVAIRQMAAEELGVPFERVTLIDGDTGITPDQGATGGSTGLTRGGVEVRQAAASARQAILKAANLTTDPGDLSSVIGRAVGGKMIQAKVDPNAPLRDPRTYKVVGKPILRPDVPAKCTARHPYVQDVAVPGMLHARIVRPPSIGAKLMSVDEASVKAIPDVRVVRQQSFLAVVAKNEWAAVRAARELKATWSESASLPGSDAMERYLRSGAIDKDQPVTQKGDTTAGMNAAVKKFSGTYYWPNQSHASLGPSCAVVDFKGDTATVWSSTQAPHGTRQNLARVFGMQDDKIRLIYTDGAGCYGGNGNDDVTAEAFLLSKLMGAPVRVQWTRQEEHAWDPKGPQQLLDMRAGLDANNNISAWEAEMWVPTNLPGSRPLLSIDNAGISQDHGRNAGLMTQNADPPYAAPNVKVIAHLTQETPLRPSNLRAPGKIANAFATESLADELARGANMDPIEFRLRGLTDQRSIDVINKTAELFGWQRGVRGNRTEGNLLIGRGFTYTRYKQAENYVGMAMEVAVDRATGRVQVRRVACAHDCGLIINPDALRNQVEGLILQTLSRTIHEEVKFDRAKVTTTDWASYPILRFNEVPQIDIALIDRPELPLYGAGEAAAINVSGALANAIFDAIGVRLRTAPFTPERVKSALGS